MSLKVHLHYGENHSRLGHFKEHKIYFEILKSLASSEQILTLCEYGLRFLKKTCKCEYLLSNTLFHKIIKLRYVAFLIIFVNKFLMNIR